MCEVMGFTCMLGYFFELIRRGGTIIGGELLNFEGGICDNMGKYENI